MKQLVINLVLFTSIAFLPTTRAHSQRISIPSIESYWNLGYSVGPGQGVVFGLDKLVAESGNGLIGIGWTMNVRFKSIFEGRESYFVGLGRLSYHPYLTQDERFDFYGYVGVGVDYEDLSNDSRYTGTRQEYERNGTAWAVGAGARFKATSRIGIFAEVNYGTAWSNMGLTIEM